MTDLTYKPIEAQKVLIIEDDPEFSYYLRVVLEDEGFRTMIADDGINAYNAIKTYLPDLITLDLLLPNKTGIKLFTQLRKHNKFSSIPIIVITSYSLNSYPAVDLKKTLYSNKLSPPEAFLEKPIESKELLSTIQRILNNRNIYNMGLKG
jgi:CheY-like chemotaxis protein